MEDVVESVPVDLPDLTVKDKQEVIDRYFVTAEWTTDQRRLAPKHGGVSGTTILAIIRLTQAV